MKRTRRNESRIQLRSRGGAIVIGLLLVVASVGTVSLGQADAYFELLGNMTAEALLRFPLAMYELDGADEAMKDSFFDNPRDFLEKQDIYLPRNFRLVAVDLTEAAKHNGEEATAVFFDESKEGFTYQYAGIGLFYDKVGVFIALAVDIRGSKEQLAGTPRVLGGGDVALRMYLQVLSSLPEVTLDKLSDAMVPVNEDDSERSKFMADPRGYLGGRDVDLPKGEYRIVAFDLGEEGEEWYYPYLSEEFPDWVREGIGFCFENVAFVMQQGLPSP